MAEASSGLGVFGTQAGKKCRVCTDFNTWSKTQGAKTTVVSESKRKGCPADREELGRCTWLFLHTVAAYYPNTPTHKQQTDMKKFMTLFSQFYPCDDCAEHMQRRLTTHPPDTTDRVRFSRWMCEMHNDVNELLGKKPFDCNLIDERWLDGWKDGSCD